MADAAQDTRRNGGTGQPVFASRGSGNGRNIRWRHPQRVKTGAGDGKTPVQVAVSVSEEGHPQYAKMEKMGDVTGQSIRDFAGRHIEKGTVIKSDNYRSYHKAFREGEYTHEGERFEVKENGAASSVHECFSAWAQAGLFMRLWQEGLLSYDELRGIGWE